MATKYITEVLKEINDNPELMISGDYKKVGNGGPLATVFMHAFTPQGKWLLPNGEPPYKLAAEPIGMTPSNFIMEVKKFNIFQRKDISNARRETIFIQMLEAVHPTEAKILLAIKDQTLSDLYPNITYDAVAKAGFIPERTPAVAKQEQEEVKK